jgi:hypothetical protein
MAHHLTLHLGTRNDSNHEARRCASLASCGACLAFTQHPLKNGVNKNIERASESRVCMRIIERLTVTSQQRDSAEWIQ